MPSTKCEPDRLAGARHRHEAAVSAADRAGADAGSPDLPGDFEQVGDKFISQPFVFSENINLNSKHESINLGGLIGGCH